MQAAIAAMAAQIIIISPPHLSPNAHYSPPLLRSSSFLHGTSLKVPRQSLALSVSAKAFTIVAATKKAVAVLKGASNVEGVVTLTQEDDGFPLHCPLSISTC